MNENKSVTMITKLTTKNIVGLVKNLPAGELYKVFGIVHKATLKETTYGTSIEFGGSFKAITSDGEAFIANKAFLPDVVASSLDAALAQSEGTPVEFAVAITKIDDETSSVGYTYGVTPLINTTINSPLLALEQRVNAAEPEDTEQAKKN